MTTAVAQARLYEAVADKCVSILNQYRRLQAKSQFFSDSPGPVFHCIGVQEQVRQLFNGAVQQWMLTFCLPDFTQDRL